LETPKDSFDSDLKNLKIIREIFYRTEVKKKLGTGIDKD